MTVVPTKGVAMRVESILADKGHAVACIHRHDTVVELSRALSLYGVGALVVSSDGRAIEGIVSERDVTRAVAEAGAQAMGWRVEQIMATDVLTCGPEDTCDQLMQVMTERRARHLPVVSHGEMVGIVSIGDVVKRRVDELQEDNHVLHEYLYSGR
jgi:CBS domain-containing protein